MMDDFELELLERVDTGIEKAIAEYEVPFANGGILDDMGLVVDSYCEQWVTIRNANLVAVAERLLRNALSCGTDTFWLQGTYSRATNRRHRLDFSHCRCIGGGTLAKL